MNNEYIRYIVSLGRLTSIQYRALLLLNIDSYSQAQLGRELNTDKGNISKAISVLRNLRLVEVLPKVVNGKEVYYKAVDSDEVLNISTLTNRALIEESICNLSNELSLDEDLVIGCYANYIDKLDRTQIYKIIKNLTGDYTDVEVTLGRQRYIVEICYVDNEVDFSIMTKEEYIDRYGTSHDDDEQ